MARVLDWMRQDFVARGLPSARLDAEVLLASVLKLRRVDLYVRFDQPLTPAELALVRGAVERRRAFEPVAYIVGQREFYGRTMTVSPAVLVPRPETEVLIELALGALKPNPNDTPRETPYAVLDVGTGSGAIAITLAAERPDVVLDAVDLSAEAIAIAQSNAARHNVSERVRFVLGSLYEPIGAARYDLIVSNPPYIPTADIETLMPDVRTHEPHLALDGGASGLDLIEVLLSQARDHLVPGGTLLIEFGLGQGPAIAQRATDAGLHDVTLHDDYTHRQRVLSARAPA